MKEYKFKIQGNEYNVDVLNIENNIAEIEVNGTKYSVEIDKQMKPIKTPKIISRPTKEGSMKDVADKVSSGAGASTIKAPLPGSIIEISVKEGDSINRGDKLLVMEAMKMENNVLAEKEGTVKSIKVTVGQSVLQGDLLIEIA